MGKTHMGVWDNCRHTWMYVCVGRGAGVCVPDTYTHHNGWQGRNVSKTHKIVSGRVSCTDTHGL